MLIFRVYDIKMILLGKYEMNKMNPFKWPVRVYYEDTDAGGVVYHARYVAFFERARTEMLRASGFSQQIMLQEDIAFAVRRMSIEFIKPAVLDDLLVIETSIVQVNNASIEFLQLLRHEAKNSVLSEARVIVASVSKSNMKAIRLPKTIKEGLISE